MAKPILRRRTAPRSTAPDADASRRIDLRIRELAGWRGKTLARMRKLIRGAVPGVTEEWKWDVPVWAHGGILCTGEAYKNAVKLTFAHGASLADPSRLFNASLGGNTRRAIDIHEGEDVPQPAFQALVRAAVAHNAARAAKKSARARATSQPRLLAGGNPQVAKGDGDAPVQAFIAAMPGWTRDIGQRLDALIVHTVPHVRKAVKWNSPFYGLEGQGWFLAFHVFARYVKVTFFRGTSLKPVPPGPSKSKETRYVDIREGELDEVQMAQWVRQAAAITGWMT